MASNPMPLSKGTLIFLDIYLATNPDIAFCLSLMETGVYFCGLSYMDEAGTVRQAHGISKNPDIAFLLAYAVLGMNLKIW